MRHLLVITLTAALMSPGSTVVVAAAPRGGCQPAWSKVPSPDVGPSHNYLFGTDVVSRDDAWAVGFSMSGNVAETLIEHWDGQTWNVVASPNVGSVTNLLRGVAAVSADDVWAVGYSQDLGLPYKTLVLHWDGTAWAVVSSPSLGTASLLWSVSAASSGDVWASGFYYAESFEDSERTLVLHWDGTAWATVPSPNVGAHANFLYGAAALSSSDAWAVGYYNPGNGSVLDLTLTLHWDGVKWSVVASPSPGTNENFLRGVAALSSDEVAAVGYFDDVEGPEEPLTLRWDGAAWSVTKNQGVSSGRLLGVGTAGPDMIAVGFFSNGPSLRTLTETWTGALWKQIPSPSVGTGFNQLDGVAGTSARDAWAVGFRPNSSNAYRTLIEHHCPLG